MPSMNKLRKKLNQPLNIIMKSTNKRKLPRRPRLLTTRKRRNKRKRTILMTSKWVKSLTNRPRKRKIRLPSKRKMDRKNNNTKRLTPTTPSMIKKVLPKKLITLKRKKNTKSTKLRKLSIKPKKVNKKRMI
jgi:hypothetical protein